jgi:hypothetical protein
LILKLSVTTPIGPRAPSPIQVIQGDTVLDKLQVEDWEGEASDDEASEEAKLTKVE